MSLTGTTGKSSSPRAESTLARAGMLISLDATLDIVEVT